MKSKALLVVVLMLCSGCLSGCGDPAVSSPDALKVVFYPLAGAANVASDVEPAIYFSSDVDESSVGSESVLLLYTDLTCTLEEEQLVCECGSEWNEEDDAEVEVDTENPQVVKVLPSDGLLQNRCYVMVCTTAVRGNEQGPLSDLGLPSDEKSALGLSKVRIGAKQSFSTVWVED